MNVLSQHKQSEILTLARAGYSFREIAKKLKVRRHTVSQYAKAAGIEPRKGRFGESLDKPQEPIVLKTAHSPITPPPAPGPKSACEPYREWIKEQLELGRNGMAIYQDLVEKFGFSNKYESVKAFVKKLKKKTPKRFDRLEFLPGEEAQVDYGQGALTLNPKTGKYRKPRLFIMTLKNSRKSFRKTVWKSSQEIWSKLHEEAFHYFGGCPQYVVLDNLKEGVIKADIYEPEINPVYATLLNHYCVIADPARVRDPDRKGTVENAIQHTQDTALKGRKFESIEEQNEWLMHWEERWAANRIHGRTKQQVHKMFEEEKPFLKRLPQEKFKFFKQEVRTVWDDGLIQIGNSYYCSQPADLYSQVIVRIYDYEIEIIDPNAMTVIRRHNRSYRPGSVYQKEEDRIYNPSRQTENILKDAQGIGPSTKAFCDQLFKNQGRPGQRRMRGVVSLAKKFRSDVIEEAAVMALEQGMSSSKAFRRLVEQLEKKKSKPLNKPEQLGLTQDHDLIRSPSEYAEFWNLHNNNPTKYH